MAENKKKILIIDDQLARDLSRFSLGLKPEQIFDDGQCDVRYARNESEAHEAVDSGFQPDVILSDFRLFMPGDEKEVKGTEVLARLLPKITTTPKVFVMSKSRIATNQSEVEGEMEALGATYFNSYELLYAAAHKAFDEGLMGIFSQEATSSIFRRYCNEHLGTEYETGSYYSRDHNLADHGMFGFEEVIANVRDRGATTQSLLELDNKDGIANYFNGQVKDGDSLEGLGFEQRVNGKSVSGRLATSIEDIEAFKTAHPDDPIILAIQNYSPKYDDIFKDISGVIVFGRGSKHIEITARNYGIPVFAKGYSGFRLESDGLKPEEGYDFKGEVTKGEWLTLDASLNGSVFKGKQEISFSEYDDEVGQLLDMANSTSKLTWHNDIENFPDSQGTEVHVNIDNAQQLESILDDPLVGDKVKGVGLVRTERVLGGSGLEALQSYILSHANDDKVASDQALSQMRTILQTEFDKIYQIAGKKLYHADAEPKGQLDTRLPVKVRLIDISMDELFPSEPEEIAELAATLGLDQQHVEKTIMEMKDSDFSPSLGDSALANMQMEVIAQAAAKQAEDKAFTVNISAPSPTDQTQLSALQTKAESLKETADIAIGAAVDTNASMEMTRRLEHPLPFIAYGTNDLTEKVSGLKRDHTIEELQQWQFDNGIGYNPYEELLPHVEAHLDNHVRALRRQNINTPLSACGNQFSGGRNAAEAAQYLIFDNISVPPTRAAVAKAIIESGRAALTHSSRSEARQKRAMLEGFAREAKQMNFEEITPTVLIVNDSKMVLSAQAEEIEKQGFHVEQATDLEEADSILLRLGHEGKLPHTLVMADNALAMKERGLQLIDDIDAGKYPGLAVDHCALVTGAGFALEDDSLPDYREKGLHVASIMASEGVAELLWNQVKAKQQAEKPETTIDGIQKEKEVIQPSAADPGLPY